MTLYESLMAHLEICRACGANMGRPCPGAAEILQAIAEDAAERIAPMPKEAGKA